MMKHVPLLDLEIMECEIPRSGSCRKEELIEPLRELVCSLGGFFMVYTHVFNKGSKGVLITIGEVSMVYYSDQSTL